MVIQLLFCKACLKPGSVEAMMDFLLSSARPPAAALSTEKFTHFVIANTLVLGLYGALQIDPSRLVTLPFVDRHVCIVYFHCAGAKIELVKKHSW
jgi:hypothetical protein